MFKCAASATSTKAKPIQPPYNVVITGSTKGIGRALAEGFLYQGDRVLISSRSEARVEEVVQELADKFGPEQVKGRSCHVARPREVRDLADYAQQALGTVDLWINNAGSNAYKYGSLVESVDEDLVEIVETNVLGVMLCCKEAIRVMRRQSQGGHIFNMDGAGADGNATPRFAAYGATKRSLAQLGKSLSAELKQLNVSNIGIHNLSPGMVTTELLMSGADTPTAKFFINCLAEAPNDVADFLVPRIREVPLTSVNTLTSAVQPTYIKFLTPSKAYSNIFKRLVLGERKNRWVSEE